MMGFLEKYFKNSNDSVTTVKQPPNDSVTTAYVDRIMFNKVITNGALKSNQFKYVSNLKRSPNDDSAVNFININDYSATVPKTLVYVEVAVCDNGKMYLIPYNQYGHQFMSYLNLDDINVKVVSYDCYITNRLVYRGDTNE